MYNDSLESGWEAECPGQRACSYELIWLVPLAMKWANSPKIQEEKHLWNLAPALSNINQNKHKYISPSTHVRCANTHTNTVSVSSWNLNDTLCLKRAVLICWRNDMIHTVVCVCECVCKEKRECVSVWTCRHSYMGLYKSMGICVYVPDYSRTGSFNHFKWSLGSENVVEGVLMWAASNSLKTERVKLDAVQTGVCLTQTEKQRERLWQSE